MFYIKEVRQLWGKYGGSLLLGKPCALQLVAMLWAPKQKQSYRQVRPKGYSC